jgi:hypothetical protein
MKRAMIRRARTDRAGVRYTGNVHEAAGLARRGLSAARADLDHGV